jgi:branched-chain amino acid transport system permease protein
MRAAALYPESSRVLGVRVGWMLALGWGMAAAVGALSGLMVAPVVLLEPNMMQGILVYAFAAAVLGGIDSPVGAVVGGLALGVGLNLIGAYVPVIGTDLQLTTAFGIIIVILLFRPAGLFGRRTMRRV